jgi:hypothetical protein
MTFFYFSFVWIKVLLIARLGEPKTKTLENEWQNAQTALGPK